MTVAYRRHTEEHIIHEELEEGEPISQGGYPLNLAHILELLRTV